MPHNKSQPFNVVAPPYTPYVQAAYTLTIASELIKNPQPPTKISRSVDLLLSGKIGVTTHGAHTHSNKLATRLSQWEKGGKAKEADHWHSKAK
jgi:hypothetical protein